MPVTTTQTGVYVEEIPSAQALILCLPYGFTLGLRARVESRLRRDNIDSEVVRTATQASALAVL